MSLKFTLGAIKAIKTEFGIDLLDPAADKKSEDKISSNFQRLAEIAIRWSAPGITEEQAVERAQFVTVGDVFKAIETSLRRSGGD